MLKIGCQWHRLPKGLPLRSMVHGDLHLWAWEGTLERIDYDLYQRGHEQEGREASPTAAVIDSQSVQAAEKRELAAELACEDRGVKHHILADRLGLLLNVAVHRADIGDRNTALVLDKATHALSPFIQLIFAEGGYRERSRPSR